MRRWLLFISLIYCTALGAQVPEPVMFSITGYGGGGSDQIAEKVVTTPDGGFIITFVSNSAHGTGNIDSIADCNIHGGQIALYTKYNSDASIKQWSRCYYYTGDSVYSYFFPATNGTFVLGGSYNSSIGWGYTICKHDTFDNVIWSKDYSKGNASLMRNMIATSDGGYLIMGECFYTDTNVSVHYGDWSDADIWLLKLDSNGDKMWSKVIGGSSYESAHGLIEMPGRGYYIVGSTSSNDHDCTGSHGGNDLYLARVDYNGNIVSHKDIGGIGEDGGGIIVPDGKGGILVLGWSNSTDGDISHQTGYGGGYWLMDIDSNNNIVWDNSYGGQYCQPKALCRALDGSIWMTGWSWHTGLYLDTVYGNYDAWVVHADSVGNFISAIVLGSDWQDIGTMLYPLSNGNILLGGQYSNNNNSFSALGYYGSTDIFLAVFGPWTTDVAQLPVEQKTVSIYPNPAHDKITIQGNAENEYSVQVYDITGRLFFYDAMKGSMLVDVSNWPKGVYYLAVTTAQGYKEIRKLVVR